jgi:hydroxyethylthiazole kinase
MSRMSRTPADLLRASRDALATVRTSAPLVQCITNSVVVNTTANALLALGAAPAMVDIPEEAGGFAAAASGLLVNLGTPGAEHRAAMHAAVAGATAAGTPWVLDPVAVGTLPVRTELAATLCAAGPDVVRGNASEILAVAGAGVGGRGVDTTDDAESAAETAATLARRTGGVVAVSGPVDVITDGRDIVRVRNGHPHLTRMTGGGCALGAVIAAFAATGPDRLASTVAAVLTYTVAAELAAAHASGPGSFAPAFLDALSTVDGAALESRAALA